VNVQQPVAVLKVGLVTSVGLAAPAACAAIRAKLTNPRETRFADSSGEWIVAHEVTLEKHWRGLAKLSRMAAMAIEEALTDVSHSEWSQIPLLLCVAEPSRPGRIAGLDDELLPLIQQDLRAEFATESALVPFGRVSVAVALATARDLIWHKGHRDVLVAATDTLITGPTLDYYEHNDRLLTVRNSNGFIPGEGAGALLLGAPSGEQELVCTGLGFAVEKAHIDTEEPLRADGLTAAIKAALSDAGCVMNDFDYRITDLSGEQYYFREASLALSRTLRGRRSDFDLWHPAESTGETGAAAGTSVIALADAACRKGFTPGPAIIAHMANDSGERAAVSLHFAAL